MNIVKDVFDPDIRLGSQTENGFIAVQMNKDYGTNCDNCCFEQECPYESNKIEINKLFGLCAFPCIVHKFSWIEFDSDKDNLYE